MRYVLTLYQKYYGGEAGIVNAIGKEVIKGHIELNIEMGSIVFGMMVIKKVFVWNI